MINVPKLTAFIIATIMAFTIIYTYGVRGSWYRVFCVILMYVGLILVALYDIGKDEPDTK